jgi:hypothetical protein
MRKSPILSAGPNIARFDRQHGPQRHQPDFDVSAWNTDVGGANTWRWAACGLWSKPCPVVDVQRADLWQDHAARGHGWFLFTSLTNLAMALPSIKILAL